MADRYNNETIGDLEPDGIDDSQAAGHVQSAQQALLDKKNAEARAVYMGNQGAGTASGLVDPNAIAAAVVANDAAMGTQKDDSFQVLVTGAREVVSGRPGAPERFIQQGSRVGLDTLNDQGFLGITDQTLVSKVVGLTNGKVELADAVYKAAVNQAAYNQKAGIPTSVENILDRWQKGGLPENLRRYLNGSGGGGGAGGSFSSVNRVVSLTDEGTARQVLNRALTSYLGREATDMENKMFLKALNVQERQNPTTTTSKGYTDGSRNTTQSQTVEGGFSRDDFAERFARSQEGYAEYQTATTYLDAFIDALESDTRVI